jgi:hypothetical protein
LTVPGFTVMDAAAHARSRTSGTVAKQATLSASCAGDGQDATAVSDEIR